MHAHAILVEILVELWCVKARLARHRSTRAKGHSMPRLGGTAFGGSGRDTRSGWGAHVARPPLGQRRLRAPARSGWRSRLGT
eukprot:11509705-Alexandrium_andersonii.AAC.1